MRTPNQILAALVTIAAAAGAMAQPATAPAPSSVPGGVRITRIVDPRAENYHRLLKPITVEITDQRLEDVMTFIHDITQANIEVLWSDDNIDGLNKDKRISLTVKDKPALALLERALDKSTDNASDATWQFTPDGAIEIGLKSSLNKHAKLKIYDIHDLLFEIPDFGSVPQLDLNSVLNQGGGSAGGGSSGGGGGGGKRIFQDQQNNNNTNTPGGQLPDDSARQAQKLIELITTNVDPPQWQDNGGSGGTINYQNGTLLVRAPEYMLRQIVGYSFMER